MWGRGRNGLGWWGVARVCGEDSYHPRLCGVGGFRDEYCAGGCRIQSARFPNIGALPPGVWEGVDKPVSPHAALQCRKSDSCTQNPEPQKTSSAASLTGIPRRRAEMGKKSQSPPVSHTQLHKACELLCQQPPEGAGPAEQHSTQVHTQLARLCGQGGAQGGRQQQQRPQQSIQRLLHAGWPHTLAVLLMDRPCRQWWGVPVHPASLTRLRVHGHAMYALLC